MPETLLPTRQHLDSAAAVVYRTLRPTPQIRWPLLEQRTGVGELWIKHENHHPVGAFKVRGGLVYMDALRRTQLAVTTVISATRGNHGQSIAIAAKANGLRAVIVVPHGNSVEKNAAMRSQGAELIEHGDDYQVAMDHAQALARQHGWHVVSGVHPDLIAGVATLHTELLQAAPHIRTVYIPVGMGSNICAAIAVREAFGLDFDIVGVTASEARATVLSCQAGHPVESMPTAKLADGVMCRKPNPAAIAAMRSGVTRFIEVPEAGVAQAMRLLFETTHNVAEGAGALSLAALMQDTQRRDGAAGVLLTGGNVDSPVFAQVLQGAV